MVPNSAVDAFDVETACQIIIVRCSGEKRKVTASTKVVAWCEYRDCHSQVCTCWSANLNKEEFDHVTDKIAESDISRHRSAWSAVLDVCGPTARKLVSSDLNHVALGQGIRRICRLGPDGQIGSDVSVRGNFV
jgi:hypothetical protein